MKTIINPLFTKIIIAIGVVVLIILSIFCVIETAKSRRLTEENAKRHQETIDQYTEDIKQKNDAYILAKTGLRQLNSDLLDFSLISLGRAVELKQDYRDAWLALGSAQFKNNDIRGALASFQKAEKLDPIYAQTYEFLKITYEKLADAASAQKAAEKYAFLTKK